MFDRRVMPLLDHNAGEVATENGLFSEKTFGNRYSIRVEARFRKMGFAGRIRLFNPLK